MSRKQLDIQKLIKRVTRKAITHGTLDIVDTTKTMVVSKFTSPNTASGINGKFSNYFTYAIYTSCDPTAIRRFRTQIEKKDWPFLPPFEQGLLLLDDRDIRLLSENPYSFLGKHPAVKTSDTAVEKRRVLLNKYPVLKSHILVTSSSYRPQKGFLTPTDLHISLAISETLNGLAFYNCGVESGRSVDHFHLQCIPFESLGFKIMLNQFLEMEDGKSLVRKARDSQKGREYVRINLPFYQFCHYFCFYGDHFFESYRDFVSQAALDTGINESALSYNLIYTSEWLLLIPRSSANTRRICLKSLSFVPISSGETSSKGEKVINEPDMNESITGIQINAMVFCGSLFAKTPEVRRFIEKVGVWDVMKEVVYPRIIEDCDFSFSFCFEIF